MRSAEVRAKISRAMVGNKNGCQMGTIPLADRFWRKVEIMPTGCYQWTGARNPKGYGMIRSDRRSLVAHRLVYESFIGSIPEGLQIDHLCRNRACVNPSHLEAVTLLENIRRGAHVQRHLREQAPEVGLVTEKEARS